MQRWALCVALISAGACGDDSGTVIDAPGSHPTDGTVVGDGPGVPGDVPGGVGEPAELVGMTLYHNQVRAAVDTTGVAGGPLPPLAWDPNLAAYAATWAAKCQDSDQNGLVDHDPNRSNVAGYQYIGENIFAAGGGTASAMQAVDLWAQEKTGYTYASNSCTGVCGHYTQIVWRATLKVGCALQNCPGLQYPSTIICDYGPGGNFNGEKPY